MKSGGTTINFHTSQRAMQRAALYLHQTFDSATFDLSPSIRSWQISFLPDMSIYLYTVSVDHHRD